LSRPVRDAARIRRRRHGAEVVSFDNSNPLTPPSHITILPPTGGIELPIGDIRRHRELLYFLVWRDIKVRYKQTVLGVLWTVIRPVISMAIFTFVFSTLGGFPSGGIPYPLLALSGSVIWTAITEGITGSTHSMVSNPNLITKVYFPRMILPLSAVLRTLVDSAITVTIAVAVTIAYGHPVGVSLVALPAAIVFALLCALGFGLWFSALSVRFRDVALALPFVVQLFFWISPVGYSSAVVPSSLQGWYWLNPMVGVIETFRWTLLGSPPVPSHLLLLSIAMNLAVLASGAWYFQRAENAFADVI
jgi:lipopolysaccharide transport system permease protein